MSRPRSLLAVLSLALLLSGCGDNYTSQTKKTVQKMEELNQVFETIKDEASAKAAESKVKELIPDVMERKTQLDAMPKPGPEVLAKLRQSPETDYETVTQKLRDQVWRIGWNNLRTASLSDSMAKLQL